MGDGASLEGCTFRLCGAIQCTKGGALRRCTFDQTARAIVAPAANGVSVIDTVIDATGSGAASASVIQLGAGAVLSRVSIITDGRSAAALGGGANVTSCSFVGNFTGANIGVMVGSSAVIIGNTVSQFGGHGISTGAASVVRSNSVYSCGVSGIVATNDSLIEGNCVDSCGVHGISGDFGCRISGNTLRFNGNSGVSVNTDCEVVGNTIDNNTIVVTGDDNVVDSNSIFDATPSIVVNFSGNLIIRNRLATGTISAVAGNSVATVVSGAGINTAGPYANISY